MPRPRLPLISRETAIKTTLQIIDSEGYEKFSLEKLARKMGVKSPSLYYHFENKEDLLTVTAQSLLSYIPLDPEPSPDEWQEWFVSLALRTYRTVIEHPRAAGLIFSYFPSSLVMPAHERGTKILADLGVPADGWYLIIRGFEKLVFGLIFADADEEMQGRDPLLPGGIERGRWPYLVEAIESNRRAREQFFEHAVRLYMIGVSRAYVEGK